MTATVYRIETFGGIGMYFCNEDEEQTAQGIISHWPARHPLPREDSKLCAAMREKAIDESLMQKYIFGFISVDQLRSWIYEDNWLKELHSLGLVISEYTCSVDDILVGHTQVIFKNHLTRTSYSIIEYFNL